MGANQADRLTDVDLLCRWRAGDNRAGDRLLRRHFASLFRFFRSKVGDDADELIQRTMVASLRGVDRFRGDASFRTYLFTIAKHELYRFVRGRGGNQRFDPSLSSIVDLGESPSTVLGGQRRRKIVVLALRQLPLELQVMLELHYWEEFTSREIAAVLEIPVGTAKTKIARAKAMMVELLPAVLNSDLATATTVDDLDAWVGSIRREVGLATTLGEDRAR